MLNPPGSDPKIVTATITLASLEGLNSASEMQRLLSLRKSTKSALSVFCTGWREIRIVPLAFLVLPLVKLLSQSALGEQDHQDNEKELYWHNSLQTEFFSNLLGLYLLPVAGGSELTAPGRGPAAGGNGATAACDRGPINARNLGFITGRGCGLIGTDQSGTITPPA